MVANCYKALRINKLNAASNSAHVKRRYHSQLSRYYAPTYILYKPRESESGYFACENESGLIMAIFEPFYQPFKKLLKQQIEGLNNGQ